jgi:hypothetical protein
MKKYFLQARQAGKLFFQTDFGIALAIALSWQIMMTAVGYFLDSSLFMFQNPEWQGGRSGILAHTGRWDGGWYGHILKFAYGEDGSPAAPAFYPLFPLLVGFGKFLTFGLVDTLTISLIVNTVALWFTITALLKIVRTFTDIKKAPFIAIALFLTSPAAIFLHMFYGEAVFLAIGSWAYLFALQRKWWAVGLMLGVLTAARLPSLLFIGLCALEFLRAHQWSIRSIWNKNILWFLLAPLGFTLYGIYLYIVRGNFFAMFSAYEATSDWAYQTFNPNILHTIGRSAEQIVQVIGPEKLDYLLVVNELLPVAAIAIIAATSLYGIFRIKQYGIPLGIFGLVSIIMFTLNSNTVSVHRYALGCISVYLITTIFLTKHQKLLPFTYPIFYLGIILQTYLFILFTTGYFAG